MSDEKGWLIMNDKFELHSKGENWYHFRKYPASAIESFSITYCHDGTVCMTGDYGCLCWQRQFFPKHLDYGFPNEQTYINYFAEKIVRAEEAQTIKTWKKDLAIIQIKESIEEYRFEKDVNGVKALECILDVMDYFEDEDNYGYIQMLEAFNGLDYHIESEVFCEYGRCYTDMFKRRFEMIQSVSAAILKDVANVEESV